MRDSIGHYSRYWGAIVWFKHRSYWQDQCKYMDMHYKCIFHTLVSFVTVNDEIAQKMRKTSGKRVRMLRTLRNMMSDTILYRLVYQCQMPNEVWCRQVNADVADSWSVGARSLQKISIWHLHCIQITSNMNINSYCVLCIQSRRWYSYHWWCCTCVQLNGRCDPRPVFQIIECAG